MACFLNSEAAEDVVRRPRRLKRAILSGSESEAEISAIDSAASDDNLEFHIRKKKRSLDTQIESEGTQREKRQKSRAGSSEVLEELKKTNKILGDLTNRMRKTERRMKAIEDQVSNCSSSSTDVTPKKKKTAVPDEVRVSWNDFTLYRLCWVISLKESSDCNNLRHLMSIVRHIRGRGFHL